VHLADGEAVYFESNDGGDGSCSGDEAALIATIRLLPVAEKISDLSKFGDGAAVKLASGNVATASSNTFIDRSVYIESPDRSSGIRIVPRVGLASLNLGAKVKVSGFMGTGSNGERYIDATAYDSIAPGFALEPLGMGVASVGLKAKPNACGLLAKIWGTVNYSSPGSYIYISDGSAATDPASQMGVRVVLNVTNASITRMPLTGQYVAVTGIVSPAKVGSVLVPAIRPRGDDDITIF
jgi:hypothetical protein